MDDLYRKALEQEDLTPVGSPDVQVTQMDPVAFTVEVPVYPSVELGDYAAVRAEPQDAAITESDVDEVLERLRKASSPWIDPTEERKAWGPRPRRASHPRRFRCRSALRRLARRSCPSDRMAKPSRLRTLRRRRSRQ